MGYLKDPKTWIPNIFPKNCSQNICTIYCPKWCKYIILPPPPPPPLVIGDIGGTTTLSPVVVVIITLIGSIFLVMAYYFMIYICCSRNNQSSSMMLTREVSYDLETHEPEGLEARVDVHDQDNDHLNYVPWLVMGKGLDEEIIKSITVCKYKKEDGLFTCTDCSVCLGEFQEDESIKILPKCSHVFHVYCIDTWLKTHLNCPLCRANVCCDVKSSQPVSPPPLQLPVMTAESNTRNDSTNLG
ncbi:RING-H2 finger protein ATL52-like [Bidens hawaiensis]|uniref:RING-H2 finger protein ATL52-like n=1 Tax=Bidens hawaiensis TaxID=980011 RepID=UPI00404B1E5A